MTPFQLDDSANAPCTRTTVGVVAFMKGSSIRSGEAGCGNHGPGSGSRLTCAVGAAIAADDELHAIPIAVAGNRAVVVVLEQFTPVVRRAERLRFSSMDGRASVVRHEELIDLCAAGDADGAAAVAFDIWHTLPTNKE